MRARFLPPFVAGLGVALWLSSSASATTIAITPPPPAPSLTGTVESGGFTNYYTFTLTSTVDLAATDVIALIPGSTFGSGVLDLYKGTPATGTMVGSASITGSTPTGTLNDIVGAGKYYYEVAVSASGTYGNALLVSGIPEVQTWAMLGLGFAALGFVGFAKRKGERRLFVD
jgi:hypothetical protein